MSNENKTQKQLTIILCRTIKDCLSLVYTLGLTNLKLASFVLEYAKISIDIIENKLYFGTDKELEDVEIKEIIDYEKD